jgi:pimeloyl-ACP methyl ester carboxylesterase
MKTFIRNRDGAKLCVVIEGSQQAGNLAFVMHGLGGTKEGAEIRAIATALRELDYTVVSFDASHTIGESEGEYEDATATNYYADLKDVIGWASSQAWYTEPFLLCGHSFGGLCTALFAENYPKKIKGLAPISTVVSGQLSFETHRMFRDPQELENWKREGKMVRTNRHGVDLYLKWSNMEDRLQYDLLPQADYLTMPVLMIVGDRDKSTPVEHQKILFEKLPEPKEFHIIEGAGHVFREEHERVELHNLVKAWAAKL